MKCVRSVSGEKLLFVLFVCKIYISCSSILPLSTANHPLVQQLYEYKIIKMSSSVCLLVSSEQSKVGYRKELIIS